MQVKTYSEDTFKQTNIVYPYDSALTVKGHDFFSEQNMNMSFSGILSSAADYKSNNFSKLFLSKKKKLSDLFEIDELAPTPVSFATYFAFNSVEGINAKSVYLHANDTTAVNTNNALLYTDPAEELDNSHFFDIVFIDSLFCKIKHEHGGLVRYLTLDYSFNINLAIDAGLSSLGEADPQMFYYFLDDVNDLIILYKKVLDFPYYVTYNQYTRKCSLIQPPTGPNFPFNFNGVLRMRPYTQPSLQYTFNNHHAHYAKDTQNSALNTSDQLSYNEIQNNFIGHTEVGTITSTEVPFNVLTLKNNQSPQNNTATPSEVFTDKFFSDRQYNKIFAGSSQIYGDDCISLGYESNISQMSLEAGKLTYFHVPYNTYPYVRLNVNDSALSRSGAIAGDHPVKADKIFKYRGAEGKYNNFSQVEREASGTFLCSWLSAGVDQSITPIWVDRYYKPQAISFISALQSYNTTSYITEFQTTTQSVSTNAVVFDKPSDLYFEPGAYYAYHHLGTQDIKNYIATLSAGVIQSGLLNYYVNFTEKFGQVEEVNEFALDGQQYSFTNFLSSFNDTQQFTLVFDLFCSDWSKPFANQIIGNYLQNGFGIFVEQNITPFIYYFAQQTLYVYNTEGRLVSSRVFEDNISRIWVKENLKDTFVVLVTGKVYQVTANNTVVYAVNFPVDGIDTVKGTFYTANSGITLAQSGSADYLGVFDFRSKTYELVDPSTITRLNSIPLSAVESVVGYGSEIYGLSSTQYHLAGDNCFYKESAYEIRKWNLSTVTNYPYFSSSIPIRDFNIDRENNFWVLFDEYIFKYSDTRQLLLSAGFTPGAFYQAVNVNFLNEIVPGGTQATTLVTFQQTLTTEAVPSTRILKITPEGVILNQHEIKSDLNVELRNQTPTNDDYVRREISVQDPFNLDVRATLINNFSNQTIESTLSYPTSALGAGYHNFAVRVDAVRGTNTLFVDGIQVDQEQFLPGVYNLKAIGERPFCVGATPFYNNTILAEFLRQNTYYVNGCKIRDIGLYKTALNDIDIRLIANQNHKIADIKYNIPTGKRFFIDEVERVFRLDVPIKKSTKFNILLKNTGILSSELQEKLNARFTARVSELAAFNSSVNNIKWID